MTATEEYLFARVVAARGGHATPQRDSRARRSLLVGVALGVTAFVVSGVVRALDEDASETYSEMLSVVQSVGICGIILAVLSLANVLLEPVQTTYAISSMDGQPWNVHEYLMNLDPDKREHKLLLETAAAAETLTSRPEWTSSRFDKQRVRINLDEELAQLAERAHDISDTTAAFPNAAPPLDEQLAIERATDSLANRASELTSYIEEALKLCELVRQTRDIEQTAAAARRADELLRDSTLDDAHAERLTFERDELTARGHELQAQISLVHRKIAILSVHGDPNDE